MDAHSLLRTLRYNWLLILLATVVGGCVGVSLASVTPPRYSATAELFVTVTNGGSTGELAQSSSYSQQQARNYSAVATREIVLGPVIDKLGLEASVSALGQQVKVSVPLNTSIISIEVTDRSAIDAADIANAIAQSLATAASGLAPSIDELNQPPVRLQVVARAEPPTSPSVPDVPLWLLFGLAGGFAVGVAWTAIREFVVAKVRTREQVDAAVSLNHIGTVSLDRNFRRHPLAMVQDPYSARAEEYRQLRGSLRFLSPGVDHKVFVVTSSVPGEGKSTTSANLAEAIAVAGISVCLVEADLRRPTLGSIFDLDDGVGLSTVLSGEAEIDDVVQEWGEHGLKVILAGGLPPNPSELLESAEAERLFAEIRSRHAVTIIDSPPVNAVADTMALSRFSTGILLVVGAKQVQARELRRAVEKLRTAHVPIHGYILNAAASVRSSHPYYQSQRLLHQAPELGQPDDVDAEDHGEVTRAVDDVIGISASTVGPEQASPNAATVAEEAARTELGEAGATDQTSSVSTQGSGAEDVVDQPTEDAAVDDAASPSLSGAERAKLRGWRRPNRQGTPSTPVSPSPAVEQDGVLSAESPVP